MEKQKYFFKKNFLSGLRCVKNLHLDLSHPELAEPNRAEGVIAEGIRFEQVARSLLAPNGLDIQSVGKDFEHMIQLTEKKINSKHAILYQPAFKNKNGEATFADVVIKSNAGIDLIELKAVTNLESQHYYDAAYTYFCMVSSGFKVNRVALGYINKEYVKNGKLTPDLIVTKDVTKVIERLQWRIRRKIEYFKKILSSNTIPDRDIGQYCLEPWECPFKGHCWEHLPSNNIFEIKGMHLARKFGLYYKSIHTMEKLVSNPNNHLSDSQMIQVTSILNNQIVYNKEALNQWLKPVIESTGFYSMDFETINPSSPVVNGTTPFFQLPVQWSLHYKNNSNNNLEHYEFLAPTDFIDPRKEFISELISRLKINPSAPIVTYNKTFERTVLKNIAKAFPEFESDINQIDLRIVDLMDVFRSKFYWDPRFKGWSIKAILPILCPDLSYTGKVKNGSEAAAAFMKLKELSENDKRVLRDGLLEYCQLDTFALVRIIEFLQKFISQTNI